MSAYTEQVLIEKLRKMNNSQQSIQTLSHWIMYHRKRYAQSVQIWEKELYKAPPERKLVFLYLANDIIQSSRKKGNEFVKEFAKILKPATVHISRNLPERDAEGARQVLRVLTVWDDRRVLSSSFINDIKLALQNIGNTSTHQSTSTSTAAPGPPRATSVSVSMPLSSSTQFHSSQPATSAPSYSISNNNISASSKTGMTSLDVINDAISKIDELDLVGELITDFSSVDIESVNQSSLKSVNDLPAFFRFVSGFVDSYIVVSEALNMLEKEVDIRATIISKLSDTIEKQETKMNKANNKIQECKAKLTSMNSVKPSIQASFGTFGVSGDIETQIQRAKQNLHKGSGSGSSSVSLRSSQSQSQTKQILDANIRSNVDEPFQPSKKQKFTQLPSQSESTTTLDQLSSAHSKIIHDKSTTEIAKGHGEAAYNIYSENMQSIDMDLEENSKSPHTPTSPPNSDISIGLTDSHSNTNLALGLNHSLFPIVHSDHSQVSVSNDEAFLFSGQSGMYQGPVGVPIASDQHQHTANIALYSPSSDQISANTTMYGHHASSLPQHPISLPHNFPPNVSASMPFPSSNNVAEPVEYSPSHPSSHSYPYPLQSQPQSQSNQHAHSHATPSTTSTSTAESFRYSQLPGLQTDSQSPFPNRTPNFNSNIRHLMGSTQPWNSMGSHKS